MPTFQYQALDASGKNQKGVLEGESERHVRQLLRERGLTPLSLLLAKPAKKIFKRGQRISTKELAIFTRQLSTLLGSGIPLEEALFFSADQGSNQKLKNIILGVRAKVLEGHTLTLGLKEFPTIFPPLYCATVSAGEHSGHLDLILNRLADYMEKQYEIQQKLKQAMVYPAIMTSVSILIVTFLMIYVVPKMIDIFKTSGQALPTITLLLIDTSHAVKNFGPLVLALLVIGILVFSRALRQISFKTKVHELLLKLPLIGPAVKIINTARFSRTLSILLAASTPVLEAMSLASGLITNLPIKTATETAIQQVREGVPIHLALKKTGYFPPMSLHLIASGESSGQLETMLERAADTQDKSISDLITSSLTLFEPFMILMMGAIILFVVLAVMLPIFSMDQLNG